ILNSINQIEKYTAKVTKGVFEEDELLQDGVIRRFQIIGEAAKRIPAEYKQQHAEIPWRLVTGMRDVLVHDYSEANFDRIWHTVKEDLPVFKKQIEQLPELSDE
ncbi:DUF86 domain-containing protein, partial [Candidatus Roizmanbacteria bacterium]|nr:DUF86 domain-containing protein [Candidatus Roizmanbacteria bacterium]